MNQDQSKSRSEGAPLNLSPCPFCGTIPAIEEQHPALPGGRTDTLFVIRCTLRECGHEGMPWYPLSAAVKAWNRRAPVSERGAMWEIPVRDATVPPAPIEMTFVRPGETICCVDNQRQVWTLKVPALPAERKERS